MEVATAKKTITFIHKQPNYQLYVRSPKYLRDSQGDRIGLDEGSIIKFENNVFEADEAEAQRLGFESLDDLRSWLREHKEFNGQLFEDVMPELQEPTVEAQTRSIFAAVRNEDPAAIKELMDGERATHNRDVVLHAAKVALEQLAGEPQE